MSATPLVSIVTPTLNQSSFIEQTLRSVRGQTYPNVEHIIVDGGSTDGTLAILEASAHPMMRWFSGPDSGMYDAVNRGLQEAQGEVVGYLNSDDLYFPWTVQTIVDSFAIRPDLDVLFGHAIRFDEQTGTLMPWLQVPVARRWLVAWGSLIQPSVFWRRRLTDTIGTFDPSLRYVGDLDLWLRALDGHGFGSVDEFLAIDRAHTQSASIRAATLMKVEERAVRKRHWGSARARGLGAILARVRSAVLRRLIWLRFARAVRRSSGGWASTRESLQPEVRASTALLGLLPLVAARALRTVRWAVNPLAVASRAPGEPHPGDGH